MKAAIYIRVSTDEQATEGYSLEVQEEFLKKFAAEQGLEVHYINGQIYFDDMSGYSLERPGLTQLMQDAWQKKFDVVLVYKIDRFARRLRDLLNLVDELEENDIHLRSATEAHDTATSSGRLMFQQLGSFAEFKRNRIVERVVPGMMKSLERGNWQGGKPPYGYTYNKEKKLLEINEREADVVRLIFKMYLENNSILQICKFLYDNGYRSRGGGRFYTTMIRDILINKIYLGKIEWGRYAQNKKQKIRTGPKRLKNDPSKVILIDGKHEGFIAQEDYDIVQEKLIANRKGKAHRHNSAGYVLTGILYCGKCATGYRGANTLASRKTKAKRRVYRCSARHDYQFSCPNSCIWAEWIEPLVFKVVESLLQHPVVQQERALGLVRHEDNSQDEELNRKMRQLKQRLRENYQKQAKLQDDYLNDVFTLDVTKDKAIDLRREEQEINREMARLDMEMLQREKSKEYTALVRRAASQFDRTKNKLDFAVLKEVLRLILKRIVIEDRKVKAWELYEPFQTFFGDLRIKETLKADGKCSVVVLMGEPLDNLPNLMQAIRLINSDKAINMGARHITISTVGLVPKIKELAEQNIQVELAVSLHGYDDESRGVLMPVNKKYPVEELIEACREYIKKTNQQITFEYILIKNITCTEKVAQALGKLLQGMICKMNLIPYNPVSEFDHVPPGKLEMLSFKTRLAQYGIHATVRMPRGRDVSAACGQLRHAALPTQK